MPQDRHHTMHAGSETGKNWPIRQERWCQATRPPSHAHPVLPDPWLAWRAVGADLDPAHRKARPLSGTRGQESHGPVTIAAVGGQDVPHRVRHAWEGMDGPPGRRVVAGLAHRRHAPRVTVLDGPAPPCLPVSTCGQTALPCSRWAHRTGSCARDTPADARRRSP